MNNLFISHHLPIEYYPLVNNFISEIEAENRLNVCIYTSHNNKDRLAINSNIVDIKRGKYPGHVKNPLLKIWTLITLVLKSFWFAVKSKPDAIMYFEPHSAITAYLYMRLINSKVKLYIHNYEYYSKEEFKAPNMLSVRWYHWLETSYLYRKADWISQTNLQRLKLFHEDYPFVKRAKLFTLPNYPPKEWSKLSEDHEPSNFLRLLYIGSLSFENTYIREIVDFVKKNKNQITLTIYSYNINNEVSRFLEKQDPSIIKYEKQGIDYNKIPEVARYFDVGLILYNAHNLNFNFNAPNKLFEYLASNLSVWVPDVMTGCQSYLDSSTRPTVTAIDFTSLNNDIIEKYKKNLSLPFLPKIYTSEEALKPLIKHILEH